MCLRVPAETGTGRRVSSRVWDVPARTRAVIELADHLVCQGVEKVTVESTSDYWRNLVLPGGGSRPARAAGQRPRRQEERPGPARDRQVGRGVAGQADREGAAAALVRAATGNPGAAGLQPAAGGPDRRTGAVLGTAGEVAGRRPDQGFGGGLPHRHGVGARHDRSTDRRAAQPPGAGRSGPGPDEAQAHRPGAGPDRPVRRPPRRAGPHHAGPDRRTHRANRHAHRPHRRAAGRNARTARPARPRPRRRHHRAQRAAIGGAHRPGQPRPERTHPATAGANSSR